MSLVDYFQTPFAYNPLTNTLVTDATFTAHLPTDASFTNPLAVTEASSGAAIPVLRSNSVGALPEFAVTGQPPQVILRSGSFTTMLTSMFGAVIAAGLDAATVQKAIAAGADAEAARKAAVEAKAGAEAARKATEAVGATTDDIVSTQIQAPGTKTRTALLGAFVSLVAAAKSPDLLIVGGITRDANQAVTAADVVWPDGTPGTFTALNLSTAFPGAVDSYKITYGSPATKTFTQPAITRNAAGAATAVPQIVVS